MTQVSPPEPLRAAQRRGGGLRQVARNQGLLRAIVAYGGFAFAEWTAWIVILVVAFERGGAGESGLVALLQLLPAAVVAPLAASIGDRYPRERMLIAAYVVQAAAMALTGLALLLEAPIAVVYSGAILATSCLTLTRPAHGALLPALARTANELTAANVATGTTGNLSMLIAPVVAGLVLSSAGAAAGFGLSALALAIAVLLVRSIRTERAPSGLAGPQPSVVPELVSGIRALAGMADPRTIVLILAAAAAIEGAIDIFTLVLALDLLALGEAGVAPLGGAIGAGGLIGAAISAGLVGRPRMAGAFILGLLGWGGSLIVIGALTLPVTAVAMLALCGASRSVMDVAGRTLLQRVTPDRALGSVLGVLEGLHQALVGLGSIAVPLVIGLVGPQAALVAVGLSMPAIAVLSWRSLRHADDAAVVHVRELDALRADPLTAPLAPPTLEWLAARLVHVNVPAGTWIIRAGEAGDRWSIIERGEVEVVIDGRVVRRQGPGESFGEIALLRDVPRTASIRALTETHLFCLERETFLAGLAGTAASLAAGERVVRERLAG